MSGRIVVGVSPRTGSPHALRWAAEQAAKTGTELLAVMVVRPPRPPGSPGGRPPAVPTTASADATGDARERLAYFVDRARQDLEPKHAGVRIGTAVEIGVPASVLVRLAADAEIVVVDAARPGRSGALGSWALVPRLVNRARCPVVVMPVGGGVVRRAATALAAATARAAATAGRAGLGPRQGLPEDPLMTRPE